MGQKIHPTGFRLGIKFRGAMAEDWKSKWIAPKNLYGELINEDAKIREFIKRRFATSGISSILIERTNEEVKVEIYCCRPATITGQRGADADKTKTSLEDLINRKARIEVREIRDPDTNAQIIADNISEMLKKRSSFRRVIKQKAETAMQSGVKGIKVMCSGRLGGHEMARRESITIGSVPLHTLSAKIDYAQSTSFTTYGAIGIKVWINHGTYLTGRDYDATNAKKSKVSQSTSRTN